MPIQESVSIDGVLEVLNRALLKDRVAISKLFVGSSCKVSCNKDLADDDTIQVGSAKRWNRDVSTVGALGIINGLFGVDDATGYGAIGASVDTESSTITVFHRVNHSKVREMQKKK